MRFETLFEESRGSRFELPGRIADAYGAFGLDPEVTFANFVSTVDGVADIPDVMASSPLVSGGDPSDRFVMALLRACCDAVVIGAGTFRAHPGPWTAEKAYPAEAGVFTELRASLGLPERPTQVVVSASGEVEGPEEKLRDTLVVTTAAGVDRLRGIEVDGFEAVVAEEAEGVDLGKALALVQERGHRRVLTEGGPRLMGQLVQGGLVDELFLTVSPLIAGGGGERPRSGLAAGVNILPHDRSSVRLLSARRSDSYLFLRYAFDPPTPREGGGG